MPGSVRTLVIAGNWKMYKGPSAAAEFLRAFDGAYPPHPDRTIIIFPPAVSLATARETLELLGRDDIALGAQNFHWAAEGAFTGELSAAMCREVGASYALVGHSERRHVFGETDEMVARKAAAAFDAGLVPVVCVGETLDERRAERLEEVILRQLDAVAQALDADRLARILVAYEPVWAIGTGVNATPGDAAQAQGVLRRDLEERIGAEAAGRVPILYGGSVKPGNAAALLAAEDVDGLLVGGASLDPASFASIAATAIAP